MIQTYKELVLDGYTDKRINEEVELKKLYKLEKGLYSNKKDYDYEEYISKKYTSAIFTLESALSIYDEEYEKTDKYYLATSHKAKVIKNEKIKQFFLSEKFFNQGITTINYHGYDVQIYDLEKLLIEFIRNKKEFSSLKFNNILNYFHKNSSKLNKEKIYKYLEEYKNDEFIRKIIDNEIFQTKKFKEAKDMKGIVLAGGSGTRLYPITEGVSKQLVPVYDKPMIYYPISTLMLAGIRDILIITTPQDQENFIRALGDGSKYGINLSYAVQPSPDGLAQAFLIGEDFIGNSGCALALGDNIFYGSGFVKTLENAVFNAQNGSATIFGIEVPDPERFGIMEIERGIVGNKILSVEEKPLEPKSNLAITGLYFYPRGVSELAKEVKPSKRGELEITTLNDMYLKNERLLGEILGGGFSWYDTGTFESLLAASNAIREVETNRGKVVACLEQIAYDNGWISYEELSERAELLKKNSYGQYLQKVLRRK